jgi:spoIIIJ-associated protein
VIASASAPELTVELEGSQEARSAVEFVERAAAAIGANVSASVSEHEGVVTVTCTGTDLGLFIGKHGQTIDAIQYLANAMARAGGGGEEVVVDAAGYRARRRATLETVAQRAVQRASATGRRVELDPMTPVERKIVHEALKDDPEVETLSEGSEPNRYVVVLPRLAAD